MSNKELDRFETCDELLSYLGVSQGNISISSEVNEFLSLTSHVILRAEPSWLFPVSLSEEDRPTGTKVSPGDVLTSPGFNEDVTYSERTAAYTYLIVHLRDVALVPEFSADREECGHSPGDFLSVAHQASLVINIYQSLMNALTAVIKEPLSIETSGAYREHCRRITREITRNAVLLCSEHLTASDWSSDESVTAANQLIHSICSHSNGGPCLTLTEYFKSDPDGAQLIDWLITHITARLTKTTWKRNPSAVQSFAEILHHVKWPTVGSYLERLIPPTLLLLDDYEVFNKIIGLKLLRHIIDNVSKTELRCLNRADVLYESLRKQLYIHDVILLEHLLPALLDILDVFEIKPGCRAYGRKDEVLDCVLTDTEMSTSDLLRTTYCLHLPRLLESVGVTAVRHSTKFVRVFETCLQTVDERTCTCALEALVVFMKVAWPCLTRYRERLSICLVRLTYDLSLLKTGTSVSSDYLLRLIKDCVHVLDGLVSVEGEQGDLLKNLKTLEEKNLNDRFVKNLRTLQSAAIYSNEIVL